MENESTTKGYLKTIGFAFAYYAATSIVYILLVLLFTWMAHWWWFFIIFFGILGIGGIVAASRPILMLIYPLSMNWLGRVLVLLVTAYMLYFSIHATWTTDFLAENAKEITVKIVATIVFIFTYLPSAFAVFFANRMQ